MLHHTGAPNLLDAPVRTRRNETGTDNGAKTGAETGADTAATARSIPASHPGSAPVATPTSPPSDALRRLRGIVPEAELALFAPVIARIDRLRQQRNAIILGHNYMTPEIFHGVSDVVGDSLALARAAADTDADVIVLCGVHFMAETAKLLNPEKTVLLPDLRAGCSLAESITPEDVRELRRQHPGVPVVTYVNTSAAVKAECDVCCTSSNAVEVVESLGAERVLFVPDEYLARWVATQTDVEIIPWHGHCEVHERFGAADIADLRHAGGGEIAVIAHPECPPDVLDAADFVGSTSAMIGYVRRERPPRVALITECSMSDNVAVELPDVEFIRPCNLCPHMKRITLAGIACSLERMEHAIEIPPAVAERARESVERMLAVGRGVRG